MATKTLLELIGDYGRACVEFGRRDERADAAVDGDDTDPRFAREARKAARKMRRIARKINQLLEGPAL